MMTWWRWTRRADYISRAGRVFWLRRMSRAGEDVW